jgi:hypothetical protein
MTRKILTDAEVDALLEPADVPASGRAPETAAAGG